MTRFIGAEYVIAFLLFKKIKSGQNIISIDELCIYSNFLQQKCNEQNIDVVFLGTRDQINIAISNYSDFFEYGCESNIQGKCVKLKRAKDVSDLEYHFIVYLPNTVCNLLNF